MSLFERHFEIYEFGRGSQRWRYTSSDRVKEFQAQLYQPAAIKRNQITQSAELARATLEITVPYNLPLLDVFRPYPPMERMSFIWRRIRNSDGVVRGTWRGVVGLVNERQHDAVLHCQTHAASLGTNALRRCWQLPCPFVLYDLDCGVQASAHRTDATLSGTTTSTVSAGVFAEKPDGWYDGGFIRWEREQATEYRFVTAHVGTTLTLMTATPLRAGDSVAAFPGCDHSLPTCHTKFGNDLNHGGQHTPPLKNPFGGDPIY